MHPVTPVRTYVLIWLTLTILTFTTYYVAQIDNPLTKLFVFAGFFWMAILLVLTLGDYFSRTWMPGGKFW